MRTNLVSSSLSAALRVLSHSFRSLSRRSARTVAACCAALLLLCAGVRAQTVEHTENRADQAIRSEARIDPSTHALELAVPLRNIPGRGGMGLPITLNYSSKVWRIQYISGHSTYLNYHTWSSAMYAEDSAAGWTTSIAVPRIEYTGQEQYYSFSGQPKGDDLEGGDDPYQPSYYLARINVKMPDGSSHDLLKDYVARVLGTGGYDYTGMFYATDGSHVRYDNNTNTLYLPDGSRYILGDPDGSREVYGLTSPPTYYIDRNGNTRVYNHQTKQWTDTLGRSIGQLKDPSGAVVGGMPLPANPQVGNYTYTLSGVGGQAINYTLRWSNLSGALTNPNQTLHYKGSHQCGSTYTAVSPHLFSSSYPNYVCYGGVFNPVVLAEIALPDGHSYRFTYNIYGEIDKIYHPGGGYERVRHEQKTPLSHMDSPYSQGNRGVAERWVSVKGDGTDEARWEYGVSTGQYNSAPYATYVNLPDGSRSERVMHMGSTGGPASPPFGIEDARVGMAYEERSYSAPDQYGNRQMLRRTLTEWATSPVNVTDESGYPMASVTRAARVVKEVGLLLDTGGAALASTVTYSHDQDLNVTATNRYNYTTVAASTAQTAAIGSIPTGTLDRTDEVTYLVNDPSVSAGTRQAYRDRNLLGLPSSTRVKNGATALVAQSEIKYDEAAYPLVIYGAVTGWTEPGTNVRGNQTTLRSWIDTSNTWIETHTQYDQCGNARSIWDAKGNQSQLSYADSFSDGVGRSTYAYTTQTISAVPDPSNTRATNTPLVASTVYDYWTGIKLSTTDANGKVTTYQYNDALNRLSNVNHPDGGWSAFWYGRNAYGDYIGTRQAINATQHTESYQFFDGLGRPVRSFALDGSQWITTDTQYDALGRVWRVSNPYLSGGSGTQINPSGNWTTRSYDALGRETSLTTPDGAVTNNAYSGNQTTVTDQAGKQRRSITDAFGRQTQVIEDPNGVAYVTNYTYDPLGNLRRVEQGGQYRYFMYDSLGRLLRVKNPEQAANANLATAADPVSGNTQWSLGYSYDNNGNVSVRTDARGVTTTYQYDNINRLKQTNYSDGTPYTLRTYDFATNGRGRFYADYESSTSGTLNFVLTYDAMGRPTTGKTEFYLLGWGWRPAYTMARAYDLMGNITSLTYPSGHTAQYPQHDVLGRLKKFNGNLGDGVQRTYATGINPANGVEEGIQYNESGRIRQERFGTQTPLYHKQQYNLRGQLSDIRLGLGYDVWSTERGAVVIDYGTTLNNGSVVSQQYWIPTDTTATAWDVRQTNYAYDNLNRVAGMQEFYGPAGMVMQQWFTYDRWGNRSISPSTTDGLNELAFDVDETSNRLYAPGQKNLPDSSRTLRYDAAGNVTMDVYSAHDALRTFDAEGRMTAAHDSQSARVYRYTYDAGGRRMRRDLSGQETWQVYGFDGELLAEYAINAAPTQPQKEYGYRNGELLITAESGGQVNWLVTDHLGSARMIADLSGSLAGMRRHDYLPFGEEAFAGQGGRTTGQGYASDAVRQKFTGYERDSETGLDYAQARYHSPTQGRFISPDPLLSSGVPANPQSWNRYTYVLNNPLALVDPSGLIWGKKDGDDHIRWFNSEAEMKAAGYEAIDKFYYERDGTWYAVDPNSNRYYKSTDGRMAQKAFWSFLGLPDSNWDVLPGVRSVRSFFFYYATGDYNKAMGSFALASVEGGTSASGVKSLFNLGAKGIKSIVASLTDDAGRALADDAVKHANCFVAGTPVHTIEGLKAIEEIKPGDQVLSWNEKTQRVEYKTVVRTFANRASALVVLSIAGESTPLTTTPGHPFYVRRARDSLKVADEDDGAWILAVSLRAGDEVRRPDGQWVRIDDVTQRAETTTVYNFEVADNHTYYVGDAGVLVHNQSVLRTVIEDDAAAAAADKMRGNVASAYDELKNLLSSGRPGKNQHPLTGEYAGMMAADLTGSGKGRGAMRVIFSRNDNEVIIHKIVDYHK
ncbi:MAG TPA: polymorphic toxin-type HINT domain-containing protein [Pyrinomonadaceae bacterium]